MKLGNIYASVQLDRNPPIYSGPEDAITGVVSLGFPFIGKEVGVTKELFGPLLIKEFFNETW